MRQFAFLLALLLAGCTQAPLPESYAAETSPGCLNLNDPFFDSAYRSGNIYFSPFNKGERVSVRLEPSALDSTAKFWLIVTDTSASPRQDIVTWSATSGEALSYVFDQDRAEMEIYWSADTGVPTWEIACR